MLDKSPEWVLDNSLLHIKNEFEKNIPSIILCSDPFHKAEFVNRLINSIEYQIIFVDMDLLYTGYIESGMIRKKENVIIFHPDKTDWKKELSNIITKISKERILVVIDSFNGVYNMFNDLESVRFINSCIMFLSSFGRETNSSVIVTGMVRKKGENWVISPGGKQIIKSTKTGVYFLKKIEKNLIITSENNTTEKSKLFKIEQEGS